MKKKGGLARAIIMAPEKMCMFFNKYPILNHIKKVTYSMDHEALGSW